MHAFLEKYHAVPCDELGIAWPRLSDDQLLQWLRDTLRIIPTVPAGQGKPLFEDYRAAAAELWARCRDENDPIRRELLGLAYLTLVGQYADGLRVPRTTGEQWPAA